MRLGLFVAWLGLAGTNATAQTRLDLLTGMLPFDSDDSRAVAAGDVDGDGDLDLLIANRGQNRLYRMEARGVFADVTVAQLPVDGETTTCVAVADADGDGDLDIVWGSAGQTRLYVNDGAGRFSDETALRLPVDADTTRAVVFGDIDGDGDQDLVVGNLEQDRVYVNDGSGVFADTRGATSGPGLEFETSTVWSVSSIVTGDIDGDGDLDLLVGAGRGLLYVNRGDGRFSWRGLGEFPLASSVAAVALGDLDGDGDLDAFLGNGCCQSDVVVLNDGHGRFERLDSPLPRLVDDTNAVALADVDGDGDLDVVTGNGRFPELDRLYLNDGAARFVLAPAASLPAAANATTAVGLWDFDCDGRPDLVAAHPDQNELFVNDGAGGFVESWAGRLARWPASARSVALGDVDGDGSLDVFVGNDASLVTEPDHLYANDGTGRFTDVTTMLLPSFAATTSGAEFADIDLDGDLDLLLAAGRDGAPQPNVVLVNDGSGRFDDRSATALPPDRDGTKALAVGDIDGDGDPDFVAGNAGGTAGAQNRIYRNDGTGTFVEIAGALPGAPDNTHAVEIGDLDGDGDLDIVVGNRSSVLGSGQDRLYLNDGTGAFADVTAQRMPVATGATSSIAIGDVDGDGDLDLVLASGRILLFQNDGDASFADVSAGRVPGGVTSAAAIALLDVELDGDLDILVAETGPQGGQDQLYVNDGTGTFTDVTASQLPRISTRTVALAVGDVDGDGDQDVVAGNDFAGADLIHRNLLRHLHVPVPPRVGRSYGLDVYARAADAPPATAFVLLSTGRSSTPLPPLGTLGLDPASLIALPPVVVPQPAGNVTLLLAIPDEPALGGLVVHAQALVQQGVSIGFTNVESDALLR